MSATVNLATLSLKPGAAVSSSSAAAQTISAAGTYDLIATLATMGVNRLTITGTVGGTGPLTGLELTFAANTGGTHVIALQDSDFSTATDTLLRSLGLSAPTNIATGSKFQFTVDLFGAVPEVNFRAKSSAGATVAIEAFGN